MAQLQVMPWLWFLIIGVLAGYLAGKIMRGTGYGLLGDLLMGIVGAIFGGFLFALVGLSAISLLGSLVTATVGAVAFLWILRKLKSV